MGKKAIRAVVDHPDLELVGLHVHSGDKEGKDAGVLAGASPVGILATRDIEDVVALGPHCVLYMQEGFDVDDLTRLLSSGINVVTTRSEFFYAAAMDPSITSPTTPSSRKRAHTSSSNLAVGMRSNTATARSRTFARR